MTKKYIYGYGGISLELAELLRTRNEDICAFVVDKNYTNDISENKFNIPVITFEDYAKMNEEDKGTITISLGEPFYREMLSEKLHFSNIKEGIINLAEYVSSTSLIGEGTILHIGSIISANCSIGRSCLINKKAVIGHDSTIGNYCVICPSVTLGGHVSIGNNCFVGLGACIRDGVTVGDNTIIGMGAVVIRDIEDNVVAFGSPAKILRVNDTHLVFT